MGSVQEWKPRIDLTPLLASSHPSKRSRPLPGSCSAAWTGLPGHRNGGRTPREMLDSVKEGDGMAPFACSQPARSRSIPRARPGLVDALPFLPCMQLMDESMNGVDATVAIINRGQPLPLLLFRDGTSPAARAEVYLSRWRRPGRCPKRLGPAKACALAAVCGVATQHEEGAGA